MKIFLFKIIISSIILFSSSNLFAGTSTDSSYLSDLERDVIEETNLARTSPKIYAKKLEKLKKDFHGKLMVIPDKEVTLVTTEGVKAVEEAIDFLNAVHPLPPLRPVQGLTFAARDHLRDQGTTVNTGHTGNDHSQVADRASRYGEWHTIVGENISYGPDNAENMVMQLIINDGIPNRSHRLNIFNDAYRVTGVACGEHKRYKNMCVITYADGFTEK